MAPHQSSKLHVDTTDPKRPLPSSTFGQVNDYNDEIHDERTSGSRHAETPPIQIGTGTPVRQGSPKDSFRDEVGRRLLRAEHDEEDAVSAGSASVTDDKPLRARGSSISFHPKVVSDSGTHLPLQGTTSTEETPTDDARTGSPPTDEDSLSIFASRKKAHTSKCDNASSTLSAGQTRGRSIAHPVRTDTVRKILLGTDTGLADDSDYLDPAKMASLTSAATSPSLDEARTPLEPVTEYFASPTSNAPPYPFSSLEGKDGPNRSESLRARRNHSQSQRRISRRSSARSNGMSPASSFLSGFGRSGALDDAANTLQEPDADGKEFGDETKYVIGQEIGRGGFSVIKQVHTYEDGVPVVRAVKIVRKKREGQSELENDKVNSDFDREVDVWRYLHHLFILPLIAVYDTDFAMFCVMKYVKGGTLFDMLRARRRQGRKSTGASSASIHSDHATNAEDTNEQARKGLEPAIAKRYIYQIASALRYLHDDLRVVHRDVKLENCLLDMTAAKAAEQGGNVLLCDFGLADFVNNEGRATPEPFDPDEAADAMSSSMSITVAGGSLQYAAPELINSRRQIFSTAVDVWAFGVCAYALITAEMPFSNPFQAKIIEAIQNCEYDMDRLRHAQAAVDAPEDAVDLIRHCLEPDINLRWTIEDVLECRFLEGCKELYEPKPDFQSAWA